MNTKEAIERVKVRFDKWALDEEDLAALQALGLVSIESEDERIRKEMLAFFRNFYKTGTWKDISDCEEWIAYLEKQKALSELGKYIAAERTKPGFMFAGNDSVSWEELPLNVRKHDYPYYFIGDLDCYPFDVERQKEQKESMTTEWPNVSNCPKNCKKCLAKCFYRKETYEEKKPAEKNAYPPTLDEAIKLYYNTYGNGKGGFDYLSLPKFQDIVKTFVDDYSRQPAEWSEEEQQTISFAIDWLTKMLERTDVPEAKHDIESVILGLKSLSERFDLQPKQEWSKKDEKMLNEIITIMDGGKVTSGTYLSEYVVWLKSLRSQLHWKPSEEQMRAVFDASERNDKLGSILRNLYNDLKKLM